MSEVEKTLTDAYYWLSMYKSGAITEGVAMEKVKEAIFEQPQLNPNQQIVLDYLKEITIEDVSPMQAMEFLKYELKPNEYGGFQASTVGEAFYKLDNKEEAQVLKVFSQWALEQEEG